MVDLITMTDAQVLVLNRMSDELGYPFIDIATDTGVPVGEVRAIVRAFREWGLAAYGPLYSEDDTCVRGSGYWLTGAGYDLRIAAWRLARRFIDQADEKMPWQAFS